MRYLMDRFPRSEPLFRRLWNTYDHVNYSVSSWKNNSSNTGSATIDPYRTFYIPPEKITYHSGKEFDFISDTSRVVDGDWDKESILFSSMLIHNSFKSHYEDGLDWEETDYYKKKLRAVQEGQYARSRTPTGLKRRFQRLDELYSTIEQYGYQTQEQLLSNQNDPMGITSTRSLTTFPTDSILRHEITVDIGRTGSFYLNEGRHRLSIAKILDLDLIPVRIAVRHAEWQDLRNQIAASLEDELRTKSPAKAGGVIGDPLKEKISNVPDGFSHPDIAILFHRRNISLPGETGL